MVWELKTSSLNPYYKSYLGNGYIGIQTSQDGTGAYFKVRSFIAGIYDGEYERLVEIPRWSGVKILDDRGFHPFIDLSRIKNYQQTLNFRNAFLYTKFSWINEKGVIDFNIRFFVSRADPHVAVILYSFTPHYDGIITLETYLDTLGLKNLEVNEYGWNEGNIWLEVSTSLSKIKIAQANKIVSNIDLVEHRSEYLSNDGKDVRLKLSFNVKKTENYVFYKYTTFYTSLEVSNPLRKALEKMNECIGKGYEKIYWEHCREWEKIWERDILVDDEDLQYKIHSCIYHLISSVRENQDHSIPPMGLSNDGWGGHIFWDADFFMFPALILIYPELAKSIVLYRYRTLEAAKANARRMGFKGACYGWQTASTGREVSRGGVSDEIHITGDVAWAQWQYYLATGDEEYLRRYAAPIIIETAKFWVSRVTYNFEKDRYEILKVVPPDESIYERWGLKTIDNSAFTNAIAKWNIMTAIKIYKMFGEKPPEKWVEIADKIYIPFFDEKLKIVLEYDGYNGHLIKQPDVMEMVYPLEYLTDKKEIERNFDYYIEKADRELGHSFFPTIHTIVACRLRRRNQTYKIFSEWNEYFLPPFNVVREILANTEGIVFLTAAAGFLQDIIYGFGGIRILEDGLKIDPLLPENISQLIFKKIFFRNKVYRLDIRRENDREIFRLREICNE